MQESARKTPPTRPPYVIRFGPFELDSRAGELRKHGIRIRLQEKPFQILHMLVERPGEAILRDEIRLRLWPNNTIVEFDHSINAAIKRLRDALGESAEEPRYVETLARRCYRFIGQLEPAGNPALQERDAAPAANAASEVAPALPTKEPTDLIGRTVCQYRVLGLLGQRRFSSDHDTQAEVLHKRIEVSITVKQLNPVFHAPGSDDRIDGLANGNAGPAQQAEVFRRLNRDMAASKLHYRKGSQQHQRRIESSFGSKTLKDLGQDQVTDR